MGHVDHGKTSLLDKIRGTSITDAEAGKITQHIGATEVPLDTISRICGAQLQKKFMVPGLLFIDTPGHHAFTSLRSRGGALADLAVVIVDVTEGFKPQTLETLSILKRFKTPFIIAANKIDRIHGWQPQPGALFSQTYAKQGERVQGMLDEMIYKIVGTMYDEGFSSDRYDRVDNYQQNVGIIPISAMTGEGIPDLLMVLVGLAQKFLEKNLHYSTTVPGASTIIEIKDTKGYGVTADIILYDGQIKVGDTIVVGSMGEPIVTKVKALLKPKPLTEIRSDEKFNNVKSATAAIGIKIAAKGLDTALSGSTLKVATKDTLDDIVSEVKAELTQAQIETDSTGVLLKADTIGSLEALIHELKQAEVPIRKALVGNISRRDVVDASTASDPLHSCIIGFNVKVNTDATEDVRIFNNDVIYQLIDDYTEWVAEQKALGEKMLAESVIKPGRFRIMRDHVFRQSNPAVVGIEVTGGVVRPDVELIKLDGVVVGDVKTIKLRDDYLKEARKGDEVAMAITGATVGRQINEEDVLYVNIPERHSKIVEQELYDSLAPDEADTFDIFIAMKRKVNPFWGK
ncbi:MAG: translation initiation factor IF-2 [Methanosarcinales archaeon]|nr:translation initiation factor IF-2 [Methanosarcinales archaeon]